MRPDDRADDLVLLLRGGVYEDDVTLDAEAWKEARMSPTCNRTVGGFQADLDVDFANEDQTGLVWT